jgi:hypothetical protein
MAATTRCLAAAPTRVAAATRRRAASSHCAGASRIARSRRDAVVGVVVRASADDEASAAIVDVEEQPQTSSSSSDVAPSDASSPLGDLISSPLFYVTFGVLGGVGVVQKFENAALVLAAFPIVGLTLLSKTDVGRRLEENILERRPALEAKRAEVERAREEATAASPLYGAGRPLLPGIASPPPHLTGALAGDRGFDPLGLGKTPEALARGVELELLHARWAMLAVVGVAIPEALSIADALPEGAALAEPVWWKVGAAKLDGEARRSFSFVPDRAFRHVSDPRAPASRHASSAHFLSPYFLVRPAVVELRRPRWVRHRGEARRRRHRRVPGRVDGRAGVRAVRRHTKPRAGGRVLARRRELPGRRAVRSVRVVGRRGGVRATESDRDRTRATRDGRDVRVLRAGDRHRGRAGRELGRGVPTRRRRRRFVTSVAREESARGMKVRVSRSDTARSFALTV